jgi:hypothetical protein
MTARRIFLDFKNQPGGDHAYRYQLWTSVGNPLGGHRNQVGIGLSYWPASLCSLATRFLTRFLESILRPIEGLKFSAQVADHHIEHVRLSRDLRRSP